MENPQEVVEKEGGTFIGVQGSFDGEDDLVLFIFPESLGPHAIPLKEFSPDRVRAKRRKVVREEDVTSEVK